MIMMIIMIKKIGPFEHEKIHTKMRDESEKCLCRSCLHFFFFVD